MEVREVRSQGREHRRGVMSTTADLAVSGWESISEEGGSMLGFAGR